MKGLSQSTRTMIIEDIQDCCHAIYPGLDSFAGMLFGNNEIETTTARNHLKNLAKEAIQLGNLLEIYFATTTNYNEEMSGAFMHKASTLSSGIEESLEMVDDSEMSFDYGALLLDISFLYELAIHFV